MKDAFATVFTALGLTVLGVAAWSDAGTTGILLWLILVVNIGYLREIRSAIINQNR